MAKAKRKTGKTKPDDPPARKDGLFRLMRRWIWRGGIGIVVTAFLLTVLVAVANPPTTPYMFSEGSRLGEVRQEWVAMDEIAPVMARSAVAAEDADFCTHWGLDVSAIQAAIDSGASRGGSTISQQVVKNVFLWQGRSWLRKALEAVWTPLTEAVWSKRRILELYLNVAEFDEGVFGVQAASRHYFGVEAADLSARQAALLASVLPAPKERSAVNPSANLSRRADGIMDGAATIAADGRAACFGG